MPPLQFILNGQPVTIHDLPPETTLLRYLRDHRRLTGTKEGCAEGDCGACSVALLDRDAEGRATWRAIDACLVLLPSLDGCTVLTVEGLATAGGGLHPAQQALVSRLGSQCGYCTPGFVMALFESCYRRDMDDPARREDQLCGNLCRCTGYRPIREALDDVAGRPPSDRFQQALDRVPAPLSGVRYADGVTGRRFLRPTTLPELGEMMAESPDHRLVAGATDLGLEVTKRSAHYPCLISLEGLPQLRGMTEEAEGTRCRLGAMTRLSDLEAWCATALPPVSRMLRYFASRQIKNRATLGGNLCNASPIGDLAPVFLALGAEVILWSSAGGERRLPVEEFFVGYRRTALLPGEILAGVAVPRPASAAERVGVYKVSKRRELDISTVSAGMWLRLGAGDVVEAVRLAFGGMAAVPLRARSAEASLLGRTWGEAAAQQAAAALRADLEPIDDHRGSAWYRRRVAENLLLGFALEGAAGVDRLPARTTGTVWLAATEGVRT